MTTFIYKHRKIDEKDLIFYGFLIAYGIILVFLSYKLNIWEDESYSLHTTSNNLATVISQSYDFEGQPPIYFLLLAIWRLIDSGIFFARLLSLLFIGLSAVFFYRLVRLVSGFEYPRWMVVVFLLNPFTVWAGMEIRLYSLMIFLSTISVYYFFRFYIENKNKYLYLFLLTSLIGLYTQYFFILEITALAFSLLIFGGWKIFFKFCLYLIPVIIFFLPNLYFVLQEVKMAQSNHLVHTTVHRITAVLHSPQDLMLAFRKAPSVFGIRWGIRIIFFFSLIYAYFKLYKRQKKASDPYFGKINIVLLTLAVLISLYCVVFALTGGYQERYMAIAFPLFILLFTLFKEWAPITRNSIYAFISLYYILVLVAQYKYPVKRYDFKAAATFLNRIEGHQEPILLYSKILLPPFTYYYTGQNPLFSLPAFKYDNNYYFEENINDTIELKKAMEKIDSPTKSYLLMTCDASGFSDPVIMNRQTIDACLKANYNITLDTSLSGENEKYTLRIRRLEIKNK